MPSHNTTIRYIRQPEGYRCDIPTTIIDNCELTLNTDIGLYYEPDINGIGLSFRSDTTETDSLRALNYDGASKQKCIVTLPKQFVKMFGLSNAPITFFPGRGGLVAKIQYTPRTTILPPAQSAPISTVSAYSSGHYGIRVPAGIVTATESRNDLLEVLQGGVWLSLDLTQNNSIAIIVDTVEEDAPENAQTVSPNPNMLYRKDGELGFLFPIPVGDIFLQDDDTIAWRRDGARLIGILSPS